MPSQRQCCTQPAVIHLVISVLLLPCLTARGADPRTSLILVSPLERQVFQRGVDGMGHAMVAGTLPPGVKSIEARAVLAKDARGGTTAWTTIVDAQGLPSSSAGKFQGTLRLPVGGWYRLEVRVRKDGQVLAETAVARIGIGDVFVTAGQSNSANFGQRRQAAQDDRVVYFDGKSHVPAHDPIPGGFGGGGTPWALMGDLLARQWNVPICFRSASLTYTPVSLWLPDAKHNQYPTLVERIRQFGSRGVRAVLWHQGESDSLAGTTAEQYCDRLSRVIRSVRKDVGYDVEWFVAQASFHPGARKEQQEPVAAGQKLVWQSKLAYPGPVTDDLLGKEYRSDGVHFTEKGLQVHAQRWSDAIVRQYGK